MGSKGSLRGSIAGSKTCRQLWFVFLLSRLPERRNRGCWENRGMASGWGGDGETQTGAEALKDAACPQPGRGHLPKGPRPSPLCPMERTCPRAVQGGPCNPEDTFAPWHRKRHVWGLALHWELHMCHNRPVLIDLRKCAASKCRDRTKENALTQPNNGCSRQLRLCSWLPVSLGGRETSLLVWGDHTRCPSEDTLFLTKEKEIEKRTWKTGNLSNLGTFPDFKIH